MVFTVPTNFKNIYSSEDQSKQIVKILSMYTKEPLRNIIITDATGGIGGNSLIFCRSFGFVNVVEINKLNTEIIKHNLKEFKNKTIINGNYISHFIHLKQDIVFLDPPWGANYKRYTEIDLYLNEISINKIISLLYDKCNIVILKAPRNFIVKKINKWFISVHPVYYSTSIKSRIVYNTIIYHK